MKTLLAFRHAEPQLNFRGSDHARPLSNRGIQHCAAMAQELQSRSLSPEAILTSTANRARNTALEIATRLNFPTEKLVENRDWYLAPAGVWLRAVQQLPEHANTAMIFGHNPGIEEFSRSITAKAEYVSFPPLGTAILQSEMEFWGEIEWNTCRLVDFLTPDSL